MTIPASIKIGAQIYSVRFEKGLNHNHNAAGQSRHLKNEIILDPDQAQTQIEDTFLHEVLHCIDWQQKIFSSDEDEAQISRLTSLLLQVIKDNKEVFSA